MEHDHDPASQTNTVLIVIVLVILVGFGVWWFTTRNAAPKDTSGTNINVTLPGGDTTPEPNQ